MWDCGKYLYSGFVFTIFGNMGKCEDTNYGTCKMDGKNRITLPGRVLDFLNIGSGDLVSIEHYDGSLCLHKAYIVVRRNNGNGNCKAD